jgi:hypothetical protein
LRYTRPAARAHIENDHRLFDDPRLAQRLLERAPDKIEAAARPPATTSSMRLDG